MLSNDNNGNGLWWRGSAWLNVKKDPGVTQCYNLLLWTSAILPGVDIRELPALDEYAHRLGL